MSDDNGFLKKTWNDWITVLTFAGAVLLALVQIWQFFMLSPGEHAQNVEKRTDRLEEIFEAILYSDTMTEFGAAVVRLDGKDLPEKYAEWAFDELNGALPMTLALTDISDCLQNDKCDRRLLSNRLCKVVTLYVRGWKSLSRLSALHPKEPGSEIDWLAGQCKVQEG